MQPDPLILAFDTSAAHCAAALLWGARVLATQSEAMDKGQAERLMPLLEQVLAAAGKTWADIDAIAVGTGPGNFTGVRIAVAAARGLALGLGIPALGVTALEAVAYGQGRPLTVALDARRGEAYVQIFGADGPGAARIAVAEEGVIPMPLPEPGLLVEHMARIAAGQLGKAQPRPAPFYLRAADAAPPSDPPPVILP